MYYCRDTKEQVNTYNEYLKTKHWLKVKIRKFKSFTKKHGVKKKFCEACGKKSTVCLHHITYENIGHEHLKDLVYLCRKCHEETHKIVDHRIKLGWDKKKALKTAHKVIIQSYK